ncbi:hypothetical protein HYV91_01470 [Candidatus Wolfebacteria bacterium]|nr:hypothetical protein [Candidatus Wolfebacteria bacterium]
MELNKQKLSLAATATMTITYIICGIFTALLPDVALKFLGWMVHLVNVEKFAGGVEVTLDSFILGLLPILFYTYLATYLFAWLYNKFIQSRP